MRRAAEHGGTAGAAPPGPRNSPVRPVHLRARYLTGVFLGGVLGTLSRYGLNLALPAPSGWPLPTLLINLAGSLLLGVLLESLMRTGPDSGGLRLIRVTAGTGFLGAFTTYSALALEAVELGAAGNASGFAGYLAASLLGGVLLSAAGIAASARFHRSRARRRALAGPGKRAS